MEQWFSLLSDFHFLTYWSHEFPLSWLPDLMMNWSPNFLTSWLPDLLTPWSRDFLISWLPDRLTFWCTDLQISWLLDIFTCWISWLPDLLSFRCTDFRDFLISSLIGSSDFYLLTSWYPQLSISWLPNLPIPLLFNFIAALLFCKETLSWSKSSTQKSTDTDQIWAVNICWSRDSRANNIYIYIYKCERDEKGCEIKMISYSWTNTWIFQKCSSRKKVTFDHQVLITFVVASFT